MSYKRSKAQTITDVHPDSTGLKSKFPEGECIPRRFISLAGDPPIEQHHITKTEGSDTGELPGLESRYLGKKSVMLRT